MLKFFSITAATIALVILSVPALAEPASQHFVNNNGEYLSILSRDSKNNKTFLAVIAAIEKAGYHRNVSGYMEASKKGDSWCRVDLYRERQILGECYTPRMGPGITIHNHLGWTQEELKSDYSDVPAMVARLRDDYRRASAVLGIE